MKTSVITAVVNVTLVIIFCQCATQQSHHHHYTISDLHDAGQEVSAPLGVFKTGSRVPINMSRLAALEMLLPYRVHQSAAHCVHKITQ